MDSDLTLVTEDNFDINVVVINPQEVKSTITSYITYTVAGEDKEGKFEVNRRYSDFDTVRNAMVSRWPGCFVPPLPPKKILNKNQASFVEERRRLLEMFCLKLTKLKHLWYSEEFQIFLRSTNPEIDKAIKSIPTQTNDQLIKKYEQKFSKLAGKQINTTIMAKISSFNSFIKKALPMLANFKQMVMNFLQLRNKHNEQFSTLFSFLMSQYERNCLSEYVNNNIEGKFIFAEPKDEKLVELLNQLKEFAARSEFVEMYYMMECEEREIEAFADLFRIKEGYEERLEDFKIKEKDLNIKFQELMAGKQGFFKSIFKSNIEDDKRQVQMEIDKVKIQKANFQFICEISTVILGHFEIDRFKHEKSQQYFKSLKKIGDNEVEYTQIKEAIFEHILENHNLV